MGKGTNREFPKAEAITYGKMLDITRNQGGANEMVGTHHCTFIGLTENGKA